MATDMGTVLSEIRAVRDGMNAQSTELKDFVKATIRESTEALLFKVGAEFDKKLNTSHEKLSEQISILQARVEKIEAFAAAE